eukprot:765820-Hanusia_phi.AAC.2
MDQGKANLHAFANIGEFQDLQEEVVRREMISRQVSSFLDHSVGSTDVQVWQGVKRCHAVDTNTFCKLSGQGSKHLHLLLMDLFRCNRQHNIGSTENLTGIEYYHHLQTVTIAQRQQLDHILTATMTKPSKFLILVSRMQVIAEPLIAVPSVETSVLVRLVRLLEAGDKAFISIMGFPRSCPARRRVRDAAPVATCDEGFSSARTSCLEISTVPISST